jgi:hypothetical protein
MPSQLIFMLSRVKRPREARKSTESGHPNAGLYASIDKEPFISFWILEFASGVESEPCTALHFIGSLRIFVTSWAAQPTRMLSTGGPTNVNQL